MGVHAAHQCRLDRRCVPGTWGGPILRPSWYMMT